MLLKVLRGIKTLKFKTGVTDSQPFLIKINLLYKCDQADLSCKELTYLDSDISKAADKSLRWRLRIKHATTGNGRSMENAIVIFLKAVFFKCSKMFR